MSVEIVDHTTVQDTKGCLLFSLTETRDGELTEVRSSSVGVRGTIPLTEPYTHLPKETFWGHTLVVKDRYPSLEDGCLVTLRDAKVSRQELKETWSSHPTTGSFQDRSTLSKRKDPVDGVDTEVSLSVTRGIGVHDPKEVLGPFTTGTSGQGPSEGL